MIELFLEVLLFILIGVAGGVVAGLLPGIHTNTLILVLFGILPLLSGYPLEAVVALIISMAITSTIVDFIPSIFLGAPEDDTALSVLPGHRLLLDGRGLEAIYLSIVGGVGVVILFALMLPLLLKILPVLYSSIKFYIHWLLLGIVFTMVLTERGFRKFWGLFVFLFAGLLGIIVLNSTLIQPQWMFFPLFTGLFGISTLLISLKDKTSIPRQMKSFGVVEKSLVVTGIIKGFFSGLIVGILPGVGSAQAGTLVQQMTRKENVREFLISLGGINTANAIIALVALYTINRARSGAAVAVERIVGEFTFNHLILLVVTVLIATGIAAILTLVISKRFLNFIERIPYYKLSLAVIGFLILLIFAFTGIIGLFVLAVSTSIGLIAPLTRVKRSFCMGVLILPVILFYSGIYV